MKVGILGGGQLALMLNQAAVKLNVETICLDPASDACAGKVTQCIHADFNDENALAQLAKHADVLTYETENIPLAAIDFSSRLKPLYPSRLAIATAQDRLFEKTLCRKLDIATPHFSAVNHFDELQKALTTIKTPAILKTRRFGYDGKGQVMIKQPSDAANAWSEINSHDVIVEQMIPFDYEVSMIAVQNRHNQQTFYPLIRNHHEKGILRYSIAPWDEPILFEQAKAIVQKLLAHFSYIGVLTVEFFVMGQHLIVNEIAPRVHNSGHWSIQGEGNPSSQFENHIRAITDQPLGNTDVTGQYVMFNHISDDPPNMAAISDLPNTYYYPYGKKPRPGRKIAHVNFCIPDGSAQHSLLEKLQNYYPRYTVQPADVIFSMKKN